MRSTRNQPFCWQEKKVLRLLRSQYQKTELVKLRTLYCTITEIDSDFNSKDINYYTKTISTYSGLSTEWIPKGLNILSGLGIISIVENREGGKFTGKHLIFTPDNLSETPPKTVNGKTVNGETFNGKTAPLEDSSFSEDSSYKEKELSPLSVKDTPFYITKKKKKLTGKRLESFEKFWSAFNYKKSKSEAADSWLEIPELTDSMVETICNAAKAEAMNRSGLISGGGTPKMAQGWISSRRWEDEVQGPAINNRDAWKAAL